MGITLQDKQTKETKQVDTAARTPGTAHATMCLTAFHHMHACMQAGTCMPACMHACSHARKPIELRLCTAARRDHCMHIGGAVPSFAAVYMYMYIHI